MLHYLKIRQKLVLMLLVISLIPLFAVSASNYYYSKAELEKKTVDALKETAESRGAHINHYIQLRQEQAKEFAGAFLPRQLSESGLNAPVLVKGIQDDLDSTFLDLNVTPTSRYNHIDQITDIETISVWDVHGNCIASTNRGLIGMRLPMEDMQKVYENGTYFRGLVKDPMTGKISLIHFEEIRNWESGNIVGAISLNIRGKILDDIVGAREGLGVSGETYLMDNKHRMITQSRFMKDTVLKTRVETQGARACFTGQKAPALYKNYRDQEVVGVYKYLSDENWCLMAEIDAKEAFATVQSLRTRSLFIGGVFIFVILIFASMATDSFIRPILKLHSAAQQVAQGHYDAAVDVKSQDEIGSLGRAFNDMTKSLSLATEELKEKSKTLFMHLAMMTRQKKELKEVNQELDSFVYTASHDLRAPLRGIASFATFLEEDYRDKLDDRGKDYIDEIRKGANKMNNLIEDLLQLSRISRIKNPYEDVNVNAMIDSVLERLKFDIQKHHVTVQVQKDMPLVHCDRIKMSEVFLNLINNGIKFSSKNTEDRPKIQVGYVAEKLDHKFFVKDNGIGIDPQYHDQVFGIFKRLHTDKEYEGTGAGLSIVKRVVEDHQGKIWIDSRLGQGATFYFTIPKDLKGQENAGDKA